jgi:DNA helicase-2/ATP-dependent DNA helicase PcrA
MLRRLRRALNEPAASAVQQAAQLEGLLDAVPDDLGSEEETRQADLRRLVLLADAFGDRPCAEFTADLEARFGAESSSTGVHLLTYHRAKGLEWDAVFLPRLVEGELPYKQARNQAALAEERRLLYVGITRARRHLFLSWPASATRSRYLAELGVEDAPRARESAPVAGGPAFEALKAWRKERSKSDGVPAYVVFHDSTLAELAARLPRDSRSLSAVPGVGPAKLERYGGELVRVLAPFAATAAS